MPQAYVRFIKTINNWIWENKKFCKNLEKEEQQILTDIELTKEEINHATTNNELMLLNQIQQARNELLEIITQEIVLNKTKQNIYVGVIKYYNIFG